MTNHHKLDGLIEQKFVLSQFWKPGVRSQGVGRLVPSRDSEGECVSRLLPPSSRRGLQSLPCRGISPVSLPLPLWPFSPCVSPILLLSLTRTLSLDLGHGLVFCGPHPADYHGYEQSVGLTDENIKSDPRWPAKTCWCPPFQSWPRQRIRRHLQLFLNPVWSSFSKLSGHVGDQRKWPVDEIHLSC